MTRKTLTILSITGLVLSLGLWILSYARLSYHSARGTDGVACHFMWGNMILYREGFLGNKYVQNGWNIVGYGDLSTLWWPAPLVRGDDQALYLPLWIPSMFFIVLYNVSFRPWHRYRVRRAAEPWTVPRWWLIHAARRTLLVVLIVLSGFVAALWSSRLYWPVEREWSARHQFVCGQVLGLMATQNDLSIQRTFSVPGNRRVQGADVKFGRFQFRRVPIALPTCFLPITRLPPAPSGHVTKPKSFVTTTRIPHWAVVILLLAYPVVYLVRGPLRLYRWRRSGRCTCCGYDLRGSGGRCPECGRTVKVLPIVTVVTRES